MASLGTPQSQSSRLLGRERELAAIVEALRSGDSCVTVAGPGGAGKSTLARAAIQLLREVFPGGIAWVSLGGADDGDSALHRLHVALEATGKDGIAPALAARGRTLTVLDAFDAPQESFEHQLSAWREQAPDAAWLITSRRTLGLPDERVISVGALTSDEALALFLARIHAVDPDFTLDPATAAVARAALDRLDRLPLAIELAASRAARVGVEALASLVATAPLSLAQRVAGEDRHKRLDATIAWSVERLPDTRFLFAISVFRASFELAQAADIAACSISDAANELATLADHHLLFRTDSAFGGQGSARPSANAFRLFDTVRAFAEAHAPPEAFVAHGRHMVARAVALSNEMLVGDARPARAQLEAAADDLFAALHRAIGTADVEAASHLAVGLARLSEPRDPATTERAVALALELISSAPDLATRDAEARVLTARARVRYLHGDYFAGAADAERAMALATDRAIHREALLVASVIDRDTNECARALERAEAAHALSATPQESAAGRLQIASALYVLDRFDEAHSHYLGALALAREVGARRIEALAVANLGLVSFQRGDLATAELRLSDALAAFDAIDDPLLGCKIRVMAARTALARHHYEDAAAHAATVMSTARDLGDKESQVNAALVLAQLDVRGGDSARARVRLEDALALARVTGNLRGAVVLERALNDLDQREPATTTLASTNVLRVGRGAYWFEAPDHARTDLTTRAPLRRLLAYLVDRRLASPGTASTTIELASHGWPGERIQPEAAGDRVYTAIGTLRRLGLGGVLIRRDGGYALDPTLPAVVL